MKALTFARYGKNPQVAIREVDEPKPGSDQLLVRVHAAAVNPIDNMVTAGTFKPILRFALPAVLGSDLAGEVVAVGAGVTQFKPGDAVYASSFDSGHGSLAELVVVAQAAAAHKPKAINFVQAAAIPMVGLTCWQILHERAKLEPKQKAFVPAGSGGIGSFAIQAVKHFGGEVATTTSTANVGWVKDLGADVVIDYKKDDFAAKLRDYDLAFGTVRGDGLAKSLKVLRPGGKLVSIVGPLDQAFAKKRGLNLFFSAVFGAMSWSMNRAAKRCGASYSFLFVRPDGARLAEIAELVDRGRLRPVIDRTFPFAEAKEALAYLATGRAKGKVVVQLRKEGR